MNLQKRILAAFLAAFMLFTFMPLSLLADETAASAVNLTDIDAGTITGKAVTELVKLGIINGYEDGTFRADNTITRGEVSKIIIAFLGQEDIAFDTVPSGFQDVDDAGHWAKKYIKLAADQKIVNGYTDGTFQPDAPVKYTEIVKMLVCSLGYGEIAVKRTAPGAPWYSGYMAVAAEQGILKNAAVNNVEDNASRGIVAILTNNCLNVKIIEFDSNGNVIADSDKTALDKFQGKEKITGIVTGVQQTGIYSGATGLSANRITVDVHGESETYLVSDEVDTMSILGRKISAYVQESPDDGMVMSQISVTKTESVTLTKDMVDSVAGGILTYYPEKNARAKSMGIEDVQVIYNGKHDPTYDTSAFMNLGGATVELICNDGDGDAEVAFVTEYETFIVNSADKKIEPPKVYAKHDAGTLVIPYKDSQVYFSLTKVGTEDTPETIINALAQWQVISVMRSKPSAEGKAVWKGVVSAQKLTGKIWEVSGTNMKIGSKYYELAESYIRYTGTKPSMKVGETITIYLDAEGKIACAAAASASATYLAYLIDADREGGRNGKAYLTFYGITGTTKKQTLELTPTVRVDDVSYSDMDEALTAISEAATVFNAGKAEAGILVTPYSQMIRYSKNSAGKIEAVDTILNPKNTNDLSLDVAFPGDNTLKAGEENALKHTTNGRFEASGSKVVFIANSSTKVLEVPRDVSDTSKYVIRNSFINHTMYQMEAFNVGSTKVAKYAISYVGGTSFGSAAINSKSPIMMVSELSTARDEETGEIVEKVSGYAFPAGTELTVKGADSVNISQQYGKWDIFRYSFANDEVLATEKVLSFGTTKPSIFNRDGVDITAPIKGDKEAVALLAKTKRKFKVDELSDTGTAGGFVFGTVMGFEKAENGRMSLSLVPTIKEDEGGIQMTDELLFDNLASAKVYLYDYTATRDNKKVQIDASLEGNIQPYTLTGDAEVASQILVYYTGAYSVKAIIIFRY